MWCRPECSPRTHFVLFWAYLYWRPIKCLLGQESISRTWHICQKISLGPEIFMTCLGNYKYLSGEAWQGLEDSLLLLSLLPLTHACCQSYIFKTFVLSFHGSCHLDDPLLFEAYIRPPIVTLEHTIWSYSFLRALLLCLWIQVQPLVDSRVEEVSFVDSDSNPSCRSRLVDSSLCSTFILR